MVESLVPALVRAVCEEVCEQWRSLRETKCSAANAARFGIAAICCAVCRCRAGGVRPALMAVAAALVAAAIPDGEQMQREFMALRNLVLRHHVRPVRAAIAVGETVILLHPPLPLVGV